jgi:adenylate kinase
MHTILITGVPGVGKTSIAEKISSKYSLPITNFGDVLFDLVKTKKPQIKHVDEMRTKLTFKEYKKFQQQTARQIEKKVGDKIITSHLSIDTKTGFKPGFPLEIVEIIKPDIIFIIESPIKEIKQRREQDESDRNRGQDLENWIDFHQGYNRALAASYSFYTGNYCYPVLNRQGMLEETFAEINQVISKILFNE